MTKYKTFEEFTQDGWKILAHSGNGAGKIMSMIAKRKRNPKAGKFYIYYDYKTKKYIQENIKLNEKGGKNHGNLCY